MADLEKGQQPAPMDGDDSSPLPLSQASTTPSSIFAEKEESRRSQFTIPSMRFTSLRRKASEDVSSDHTELLVLACCLCSGLTDATIFAAYGSFVSMQTGNTIFLGLGASGQDGRPYAWAESLISLFTFCFGCYAFPAVGRILGLRRRSTLVSSFLLQSIFVFISAAIFHSGIIDGQIAVIGSRPEDIKWNQVVPIILLSFQAAGQIAGARKVGIDELPTVVVTSMLYDLFADPNLGAGVTRNVKRNRRAIAFVLHLVGAIAGGCIARASMGVQHALFVVGGIKVAITVAWMFWSAAN